MIALLAGAHSHPQIRKLGPSSDASQTETDAAQTLSQLRSEIIPSTPSTSDPLSASVSNPADTRLENAPVLSLFDNSILRRYDGSEDGSTTEDHTSLVSERDAKSTANEEYIRRTLLSLFPSKSTLDIILSASQMWWTASQSMLPQTYGTGWPSMAEYVYESQASNNIQKIAKALLCVAVSLQEAPPSVALDLGPPYKLSDLANHWLQIVTDLVISNDELAGTMDGIECMFLQAKIDINQGRIRRAWVTFRRGLSFCQLLGLHVRPKYTARSQDFVIRGESLWKALYQGDRFLSLILGLPYGVSESHCTNTNSENKDDTSKPKIRGAEYFFRLSTIVGHIIDRNQTPSSNDTLPSTIVIDGELAALAARMPPDWWNHPIDPTDILNEMYSHVLPQFWHHQARTLLHLPFMLKAATDKRYEYNRIATLESAREMLHRYRIFRPAQGFSSLVCKVLDFQVFTPAMVLVLNLFGLSENDSAREKQEADQDEELVIAIYDILHQASLETEGGVTTQAARALRMFCRKRRDPCPLGATTGKVVIPYFGTVVFGRGKSFTNEEYIHDKSKAVQQPVQLPTPETISTEGSISDPSNMDNFLATMPSDLNFGGYPLQQTQNAPFDGGAFANVNFDLDQDWSWFWDNTNMQQ